MPELTPVRGIITAPHTEPLSGTGQVSYGVTVGSTGATERWAYAPTVNSPNGGIYDVTTAGVWTRATDLDFSGGAGDFANMPHFYVREGNSRIAGSEWWYSGPTSPTDGVTNITFTMRTHGDAWVPGTGMDAFNNEMRVIERGGVSGTLEVGPLSITHTDRGVASSIVAGYGQEVYIEGLRPRWNSVDNFYLEPGAAWSPGAEMVIELITERLGLAMPVANDLFPVYLKPNVGAPDGVEIVLGAPGSQDVPYAGSARTRDDDTSARYVCTLKTNASQDLYNFYAEPLSDKELLMRYLADTTASPFAVLTDGRASAFTTVSCSGVVPPTSRMAYVRLYSPSSQVARFSIPGISANTNTFRPEVGDAPGVWLPLDSTQSFTYKWETAPTAGNGLDVQVLGYQDRR